MTGNIVQLRLAALVAAAVLFAGCAGATTATGAPPGGSAGPTLNIVTITPLPEVPGPNGSLQAVATMPSWFAVSLTDVNTGTAFTISQFAGKVVLIDTMATWCPTCQGEMSQMQDLINTLGPLSDLVVVSLDVDPNEDANLLAKYTKQNNFSWHVAIAPTEVGQFLAQNYDINYLNPPLQPMLFIDRQGSVYGLPTGVKSASSLQLTLEKYLAP